MAALLSKNRDELMVITVASCENKNKLCDRYVVINSHACSNSYERGTS